MDSIKPREFTDLFQLENAMRLSKEEEDRMLRILVNLLSGWEHEKRAFFEYLMKYEGIKK